jgi:hypothetical protein
VLSVNQADGLLYLVVRRPDGTFGDWSEVPGVAGEQGFQAHDLAITAMQDGSSQLVALGPENWVWHQIRSASGAYTGFARMNGYGGASTFTATSVSIAGMYDAGSAQVVAVGIDGRVYHNGRFPNGTWTGWEPPAGPFGSAGITADPVSITALPNNQSIVLATVYKA